jgi:hypothetical protein
VQSQQLPTESQVLEDEVLPGTENADQPTEEMSKRHDHGKNCSGKIRIELCAKSFILQVYDVFARHRLQASFPSRSVVFIVIERLSFSCVDRGIGMAVRVKSF